MFWLSTALKKITLLFLSCLFFICSYSQNINWMLGTWKGSKFSYASQIASKTIVIDSIGGNSFKGTKTSEADDRNHSTIVTAISGSVDNSNVQVINGKVLYKRDPSVGKWVDCGFCPLESRLSIVKNNLILTIEITGCNKGCNGISNYAKPLCDFDSSTQLNLVMRFGSQAQKDAFKPCNGDEPPPVPEKLNKDSLKNAALIAKRKQQQIADSAADAQRLAKLGQQRLTDSLQAAASLAEKQRRQRLQDSIANAQNLAKLRQQQIADSLKQADALAKKRQQQIDDSVSRAKALALKEQQRIDDSINIAKALALKEQQRISDSINTAKALALKEQQRINDSIGLAKIKEQKRIADSINNAKALALKEQKRIADSINEAKALALKRQKKTDDSVNLAKTLAIKRQQRIDDSVRSVVNAALKKQKQLEQDSIKKAQALARIKQQQKDSVKNALTQVKKNPPPINPPAVAVFTAKDSAKLAATNQAFSSRNNVLLESYHITTPDILVELFDNAEIDGDRVSVFHNGTLIVNNKTLLKEPITFNIHADTTTRMHEFVMVAENLGSIPPNTALMRITVGKQRYSLGVKTDLSTNAKIVFYYDGN